MVRNVGMVAVLCLALPCSAAGGSPPAEERPPAAASPAGELQEGSKPPLGVTAETAPVAPPKGEESAPNAPTPPKAALAAPAGDSDTKTPPAPSEASAKESAPAENPQAAVPDSAKAPALPENGPIQTGASGAPPVAKAQAPMTADELNDLKVRTLEERVSDLKEKIFRTKARLMNLQEMVIGGDITSGAKAVVVHRNEMGSSFYLESAAYALDGAPIYTKVDVDGDLEKRDEFEIFNGRVVPGNHQVAVQLVYRGHGYGLFSYLEGFRFKVQSSYTFTAEPGKVNTIKVVGYEKGGITAELKDRPAVRYDVDTQKETRPRAQPAAEGSPR